MNSPPNNLPLDLLNLYKSREVNRVSAFGAIADQLDPDNLAAAYVRTRHSAPRRHQRNKSYFVDHGTANRSDISNRVEEHLAMALYHASKDSAPMPLPTGGTLEIIDYQTPLKARQKDKGVGKVDLFGLIDGRRGAVIELKVRPKSSRGDTPLRAYLEALAYCAIVDANTVDIAADAKSRFAKLVDSRPPGLIVMAPLDYWAGYVGPSKAGEWWPALRNLASVIDGLLNIETHFIGLRDVSFKMGDKDQTPQMTSQYSMIGIDELDGET